MSTDPLPLFRPDVPYVSQAEERCLLRYQFEDVPGDGPEGPVYQGSMHTNWNPNTDPSPAFNARVFHAELVLALRMVLAKQGKRLIRADTISRVSFELGSSTL